MSNSPAVKRTAMMLLAMLLATVSAFAGGTPAWIKMNPPTSPPALTSITMTYDPVGKKVVSFGGWDGTSYSNDTWLFDGTTWRLAVTTNAPPVRAAAAITFDQPSGKLIMFGGFNGTQYLGDTWIWDGTSETWSQADPTHVPTAVTLPMMFMDPVNGRAEMFGGFDGQFYQDITWQWSGSDWSQLNPATSPTARGAAVAANDLVHNTVVLWAGLADVNPINTWTWDGTNWTLQSPAALPPWTYYSSAAFDPGLNAVVVFGGGNMGNTTWAWTGSNWRVVPTAYAPHARLSLGMAYDSDSNQLLIFGGENSVLLNDTYKLVKR
jgi:hypothetical protein